ncbi:MAG: L-threonylcarbamoyladenylate synthase [Gammaproteobacteria bacterium]|nr:L-threonylcarbamoyladenylate synthase [Gammaproteobacteria bacterium]
MTHISTRQRHDGSCRIGAILDLKTAADVIVGGGVVVHALEGVWGLACDPFDERAVERVLRIKRRRHDKGLLVVASSASFFEEELACLTAAARRTVIESWPGAETWVVETRRFPPWITGGRPTVAIRVPGHRQARALAGLCGGPIVSTSANVNRFPPATTELRARRHFQHRVDFILPGSTNNLQGPSRIRLAADGSVLR